MDFHPNGSLVAVGTMGQHASVYDLRDPKKKLAQFVHGDHNNVYSVRFEMSPATSQTRTNTSTQDVNDRLSFFALSKPILFF